MDFQLEGLFGDDSSIAIKDNSKEKIKKLVKQSQPIDIDELDDDAASKILKKKNVSITEKLNIINKKVLKTLGKQKANVIIIKTIDEFQDYITKAISVGRIAIDTETNNSLDPVTCKLMGLCLYVPGEKQAYIPINHRDPLTKERLSWQLTEEDVRVQLKRIVDAKIVEATASGWEPEFFGQSIEDWYLHNVAPMTTNPLIIMHNGKFDYEVIKCTCRIAIKPDWDTMVANRLYNENEKAGLKELYTKNIDPTQAKYHIDELFEAVAYADVDPDIFALYAATDSLMTDKVYLYQVPFFTAPEQSRLYNLFINIEMWIVVITAEMELKGVCVDEEFGAHLHDKYAAQLDNVDARIAVNLQSFESIISKWRLTKEANEKTKQYQPKKSKLSYDKLLKKYPNEDANGKRFSYGKSKSDQLDTNINLSSPVQLAILFYDVIGIKFTGKSKDERGTGKEELQKIKNGLNAIIKKAKAEAYISEADTELELDDDGNPILPEEFDLTDDEQSAGVSLKNKDENIINSAFDLCSLILERRGILKIITTYVDVIPTLAKHWPDGRIRFHLNSLGTDTGRYSSGGKIKYMENEEQITVSGINIQNIPSHNPEIRMLFKAAPGCRIIGSDYSAQEPRMTTHLSQDPTMLTAYNEDKDLYAMIAMSAFDNNYEDNLEFYPEGTELEIDGRRVVSGTGKESMVKTDSDDGITVNYYDILETVRGDKTAEEINIGEKVISDIGELVVAKKVRIDNKIVLTFAK